ncbi:hypothetical protein QCA50_007720 [Cerrena zonata]|uniref:Uncharacterized protein n=1 Tax=Cerrena zonata TaxID=2478898 RepID=A0AAW0GCG3_9APHY
MSAHQLMACAVSKTLYLVHSPPQRRYKLLTQGDGWVSRKQTLVEEENKVPEMVVVENGKEGSLKVPKTDERSSSQPSIRGPTCSVEVSSAKRDFILWHNIGKAYRHVVGCPKGVQSNDNREEEA